LKIISFGSLKTFKSKDFSIVFFLLSVSSKPSCNFNFLSAKKWTVLSGNKKIRHKYSAFKESSEENQNLKEILLKLILQLKTA